VDRLLVSEDASVRYKILNGVLGLDAQGADLEEVRQQVRISPRVRGLLDGMGADGHLPGHPYQKWMGAHWVLALITDLGYPPGDPALAGLVDQMAVWVLGQQAHMVAARPRRCASQEGNALLSMVRLGYLDDRAHELARRLRQWQWADGGWNCDKRPEATHSSFHESLRPMRALAAYAHRTRDVPAATAARRAAEMFLERRLYRRRSNGEVINPTFVALHYPYFWQYTIIHALVGMAEQGLAGDPRCSDALDLLESKRLHDGGFATERRHYRVAARPGASGTGLTTVRWGPGRNGGRTMNELLTADALAVLRQAGRVLDPRMAFGSRAGRAPEGGGSRAGRAPEA
jgi:hypothetical protein